MPPNSLGAQVTAIVLAVVIAVDTALVWYRVRRWWGETTSSVKSLASLRCHLDMSRATPSRSTENGPRIRTRKVERVGGTLGKELTVRAWNRSRSVTRENLTTRFPRL